MLTQYKHNDLYAVHPSRKILPEVLRIPPGALVFLVPFVDGRFDTLKSSFITETQTNYFCFLNFCKKWRFLTIFAPVWSQRRNERLKFWLVTRFVFFVTPTSRWRGLKTSKSQNIKISKHHKISKHQNLKTSKSQNIEISKHRNPESSKSRNSEISKHWNLETSKSQNIEISKTGRQKLRFLAKIWFPVQSYYGNKN